MKALFPAVITAKASIDPVVVPSRISRFITRLRMKIGIPTIKMMQPIKLDVNPLLELRLSEYAEEIRTLTLRNKAGSLKEANCRMLPSALYKIAHEAHDTQAARLKMSPSELLAVAVDWHADKQKIEYLEQLLLRRTS